MVAARGYDLVPEADGNFTATRSDGGGSIMVFFVAVKLGLREVRQIVEEMQEAGAKEAVAVLQSTITPPAKAAVQKLEQEGTYVDVFQASELLFNLPDHELVPPHRILTSEERTAVLQRFGADLACYPRISSNDPVVRYYGGRKGQMVHIARASPTAGLYDMWRVVV